MNGIIGDPEVLRESVLAAARREAAALAAAAEREAAALLASARAGAGADGRALAAAAKTRGARERAALLSSVPAEAALLRALRLEALLENIRARAAALLAGGSAAPDLAALAAEAAAGIGGRSFVLTSAPGSGLAALAGEIERRAGLGALELAFEEDPAAGPGVTARSADGSRRWDNTLAARLERRWPELRRRLGAELASGRAYGR